MAEATNTPGVAHDSHGAVALQNHVLVLPPANIVAWLPNKFQGLLHQHDLLIEPWLELYSVAWVGLADGVIDGLTSHYPGEAGIAAHPLPSFADCTQMPPLSATAWNMEGVTAYCWQTWPHKRALLTLHGSEPVQAESAEDIGQDIVWQVAQGELNSRGSLWCASLGLSPLRRCLSSFCFACRSSPLSFRLRAGSCSFYFAFTSSCLWHPVRGFMAL